MTKPLDYLGALQSIFKLAYDFNYQLGARVQITQVKWAFYLDKESNTSGPVELNLANSATPKSDLALIEFSVGQSAFAGHTLATPIPAFSNALESALKTCLKIVKSSHSNDDGFVLTESQVEITFMLDDQNQLEFTRIPRDAKTDVIHKITVTLQ